MRLTKVIPHLTTLDINDNFPMKDNNWIDIRNSIFVQSIIIPRNSNCMVDFLFFLGLLETLSLHTYPLLIDCENIQYYQVFHMQNNHPNSVLLWKHLYMT